MPPSAEMRTALHLSRFGDAVERRHGRRTVGRSDPLGGRPRRRTRSGVQHRHRRRVPLAVAVAAWSGGAGPVASDLPVAHEAGFTGSRDTRDSFFDYAERYHAALVTP